MEYKSYLIFKSIILEEQDYKCPCGVGLIWHYKPLTLQLHHIDGNHKNNARENLVILCPNCHTQTDTYYHKKIKSVKCTYKTPLEIMTENFPII